MSAPYSAEIDDVPADLLATISSVRRGRRHSGLVLALPGYWGATALRERLSESTVPLVVQGIDGEQSAGLSLRLALASAGGTDTPGDPADGLEDWVSSSVNRPLIIVESPRTVDGPSLRAVSDLAARDRAFVVVLTSVLDDVPEPLQSLVHSGRLGTHQLLALEHAALTEHLTRVLGSAPGSALVFTAAAATGGHRALVPVFLRAALRSGVLHRTQRMWHWTDDWESLRGALVEEQARILGTMSQQTVDDLVLFALAGSLPQPAVIDRIGPDRLSRLREQQLLGIEIDPDTAERSLSIRPKLVETLISQHITTGEAIRLWHQVGRNLSGPSNGAATTAGSACWELRTGIGIGTARAEEAAGAALRSGRFSAAAEVLAALPAAQHTARTRLLSARAQTAQGDVDRPLRLLAELAHTDDPELCREAVILALRICLFHREAATGVVRALTRRWQQLDPRAAVRSEALSLLAGYATGVHAATDLDPEHAPMRYADAAESYICRLWEGAELSFRLSPQRPRPRAVRVAAGGRLPPILGPAARLRRRPRPRRGPGLRARGPRHGSGPHGHVSRASAGSRSAHGEP
jgi:hypothetical protein